MGIWKDFEEKKVSLLGRRGREAPRCRPGGTFQIKPHRHPRSTTWCAGGTRYIWNVLLVRHQGALRLRNEVKD